MDTILAEQTSGMTGCILMMLVSVLKDTMNTVKLIRIRTTRQHGVVLLYAKKAMSLSQIVTVALTLMSVQETCMTAPKVSTV